MSEVPVKVYVRVRPLLGKELLQSDEVCLQIVSSDQLVLGRDRSFRFDAIFQPDATQTAVYESCVQPLMTPYLDGYNVTVLAYGQTGSGKSFTMGSEDTLGVLMSAERRGLIPRSLEELFDCIAHKKEESQYTVKVSYLEIYKEELRDLLWSGCVMQGEGPHELHIRENEGGNTVVLGCSEQLVQSADEALSWLGVGNAARITEATQMNQRSSRSHAVFTIHLKKRRRHTTPRPAHELSDCVSSKFHFVDLAGSERASRTGNRGERFKESVHINSGLLAMGNVISALSDPRRRGTHVPYRESKITRLLKDSLGGNASTVMITCLSPAAANFAENLNSLKYAKRARKIQNRPVINRDTQANKLQQMKDEIVLLRDELVRAKMEAQLVASSKSSSNLEEASLGSCEVGVVSAGGSDGCRVVGVVGEAEPGLLLDVEQQVEGLEEHWNQSQVKVQGYVRCLRRVREMLVALLDREKGREGGERGREGGEREREGGERGREGINKGEKETIKECVHLLTKCEDTNADSAFQPADWPQHEEAEDTISRLRLELERCHVDLHTDELAFAEKMEELAELQSTCETLVREKERAEAMWLAAQESEVGLQLQVEEMSRRLAAFEREGYRAGPGVLQGGGLVEVGGGRDERRERGTLGPLKEGEHYLENAGPYVKEEAGHYVEEGRGVRRREGEVKGESVADVSVDSLSGGGVAQCTSDEQRFEATRSLLQGKVKTDSLECFSEEAVLASLHVLTQCLLEGSQRSPEEEGSQRSPEGEGSQRSTEELESEPMALGDTRILSHHQLPLATIQETAESAVLSEAPPTGRPATPSEREPRQRAVSTGVGVRGGGGGGGCVVRDRGCRSEMELLNESAVDSRQQLLCTEDKLSRAHEELRCLTIKIKLKQELIRELSKTSRTAKRQGQAYLTKIQSLEEEAGLVREELTRVQGLLQKYEKDEGGGAAGGRGQDSERVMREHKQRLAQTEKKLAALQKKQKDTARLASYGLRSERRIDELESGIERLRNQQESLRRKLKKQTENKTRLENNLQKYLHRIKALQTRSEQQSKVLRVKTEEAAAAQRKLRQLSAASRPSPAISAPPPPVSDEGDVMAQKEWLEIEVEKVLKEKQAVTALEKELEERERIVREKEALVLERDSLELKKLQSGHVVARQLERMSMQMRSVDSQLQGVQSEEGVAGQPEGGVVGQPERGMVRPATSEQREGGFKKLSMEKEKLVEHYQELKKKMSEGDLLSTTEQQKLLSLNEQVQILEAAIEFKNDSILSKKSDIHTILTDSLEQSHSHSENSHALSLREKLSSLKREEVCELLELYFQKVVELRGREGKERRVQRELEVELGEEREGKRRAEAVIRQVQLEGERSLAAQQVEHDKHVQLLLEIKQSSESSEEKLASKVRALEKDLYYYRKTSRELRKKLQVTSAGAGGGGRGRGHGMQTPEEEHTNSAPELEAEEQNCDKVKKRQKVSGFEGVVTSKSVGVVASGDGSSRRSVGVTTSGSEVGVANRGVGVASARESSCKTREGIEQVSSVFAKTEEMLERADLAGRWKEGVTVPVVGGATDGRSQEFKEAHPPEGKVQGGSGRERVVKKHRRELRQLSASDLTERQRQSRQQKPPKQQK